MLTCCDYVKQLVGDWRESCAHSVVVWKFDFTCFLYLNFKFCKRFTFSKYKPSALYLQSLWFFQINRTLGRVAVSSPICRVVNLHSFFLNLNLSKIKWISAPSSQWFWIAVFYIYLYRIIPKFVADKECLNSAWMTFTNVYNRNLNGYGLA